MDNSENAACSLKGRILNERWRVLDRVDLEPGSTGGKYSIRYVVEELATGNKAFLKALNYKAFFNMSRDKDPVAVITFQNSAFEYERDVLIRCRGKKLTKVTMLYDTGTEHVDGFAIPTVPFLIFEMADGDIRTRIDFSNTLDLAWKLNSLHNVAVGLMQLHGIGIGHQDLKPSNILLYEDGIVSKIGDLGNSLCSDIKSPHETSTGRFTGDSDYIPIEFLYRHIEPEPVKRRRATDMYLFGGLVCFYFTGLNMTSLIVKNVERQFRWTNWNGDFRTVKDYLMPGFYKAIRDFEKAIPSENLARDLSKMLEYLCFPYPDQRGHPGALKLIGNQYDFQRIVSKLTILHKKVELELFRYGN